MSFRSKVANEPVIPHGVLTGWVPFFGPMPSLVVLFCLCMLFVLLCLYVFVFLVR